MGQASSSKGVGRRSLAVRLRPIAWVLALVLGLYFFSPLSTVLLGVLAASIIACTLHPLVAKLPAPRGVNVAILGLGLVAILLLVVLSLSWPLAAPISHAIQKMNWPQTQQQVNLTLKNWSTQLGLQEPLRMEKLLGSLSDFLLGPGGQQLFSRGANVLLGILISLVFTLVGSVFLLSEPAENLIRPALALLSPHHRPIVQAILDDLGCRYRRWVTGTLAGMFVVFSASIVGYTAIGLDLAIPLALLAGFAEIVPTVGPATASIIAAVFAAATQGPAKAAGVMVIYVAIQAVEAYVILPLIMRGAVNIHPAVTLFTVVLWGKIFGVPGLMLAIPLNLTIWTIFYHFRVRESP